MFTLTDMSVEYYLRILWSNLWPGSGMGGFEMSQWTVQNV